jgi:murein DD-endopeptidase MepM/ murein hydrolase activator NlpD
MKRWSFAVLSVTIGFGCVHGPKRGQSLRIAPMSQAERDVLSHLGQLGHEANAQTSKVSHFDGMGGGFEPKEKSVDETLSFELWSSGVRDESEEDAAKPDNERSHTFMLWPVDTNTVTSLFGPRTDPISGENSFHYGVDLRAGYGEQVKAVAAGYVIWSGWRAGHGRLVMVDHGGGWTSSYSHLSQIFVTRGRKVTPSQVVGLVGTSGRSTAPHLHLETKRYGLHRDPLSVLDTLVPLD